jgi:hypothetical protein
MAASAPADIDPEAHAGETVEAEPSGSETPAVAETPALDTPVAKTPVGETPVSVQTPEPSVVDPKRRRRKRKRKMAVAPQSPETAPAP